jgi:N,N'-diacetyllegionaminate synthase
MADAARECGVDFIKFQTFFGTQEGLEKYQFTYPEWKSLFRHCEKIHMPWFSTPFDIEAISFLRFNGMGVWKIPSGLCGNVSFLKELTWTKETEWNSQRILSTGMSTIYEIAESLSILGTEKMTLLHCISAYPPYLEEHNLSVITKLKELACPVGYSDHTTNAFLPLVAIGLGAVMIEKHFRLDEQDCPDFLVSMQPRGLARLVKRIRVAEKALGDGVKKIEKSEEVLRNKWKTA